MSPPPAHGLAFPSAPLLGAPHHRPAAPVHARTRPHAPASPLGLHPHLEETGPLSLGVQEGRMALRILHIHGMEAHIGRGPGVQVNPYLLLPDPHRPWTLRPRRPRGASRRARRALWRRPPGGFGTPSVRSHRRFRHRGIALCSRIWHNVGGWS